MSQDANRQPAFILSGLRDLLPDLESLYKDLHSHPELSMQETRTAVLLRSIFALAGMK